ncbi:26S proteasome non-ATPase regulatory subunit 6 [Bulinus truncatus]|nr:26S proteasome non-ATPase regulatory subunit 6 [Bulinus truncatus]
MPVENLEEQGLAKNPNLEHAQLRFLLGTEKYKNDADLKKKLLNEIVANDMAPFYEEVVQEFGWVKDEKLLGTMKAANEAKLKVLDDAITDAEKSLGETEIRDSMLSKAEYLCQIGDKASALSEFRKTYDKTAQSLIDEGGDWDRRNRLKRPELREKVVKGAEILEVLHSLPNIRKFLFSLYDCQYSDFFVALAEVENVMKYDRLLSSHYSYYVREMRIMAYAQLLESYRSLTLDYMAKSFGVTELARFIAAGRLHCKIDKVGGIVETNRPDSKNWQYQNCIKQGDILLNRVQKLSRVINI